MSSKVIQSMSKALQRYSEALQTYSNDSPKYVRERQKTPELRTHICHKFLSYQQLKLKVKSAFGGQEFKISVKNLKIEKQDGADEYRIDTFNCQRMVLQKGKHYPPAADKNSKHGFRNSKLNPPAADKS